MPLGKSQRAVATGIIRAAQNDDTLFNLIGGRIQRAEDPTTRDITLPAIVFTFLPGRTRFPLQKYYRYNIHFLIYSSKSAEETEIVYEALMDALHMQRITQDNVNFVLYPTQAPSDNVIEEAGNFVLSGFWIAKAIEP